MLEQLARTDALSGLHNRRVLDELLAHEFWRALRYRRPLMLLMADIDHFKRVNDEHGHAVGDRVLQQTAAALGAQLRESDVLARYGGEEFAALLPETTVGEAALVAEKLRAAVAAAVPAEGPRVTISLRVAGLANGVLTASGERPAAPGELLAQADAALYQAKREGRSRVVIAVSPAAARSTTVA